MSISPSEISAFYNENGYYHAKGVFSPQEIAVLEQDFDHMVHQLHNSGEQVDIRWSGAAIDKIAPKNTTFVHTHNVQIYSANWLRAFLQERFLDHARAILN